MLNRIKQWWQLRNVPRLTRIDVTRYQITHPFIVGLFDRGFHPVYDGHRVFMERSK